MSKNLILLVLAVLIALFTISFIRSNNSPFATKPATSFEDCVAAGNPVMTIYPPQCRTSDGQLFVQDIGNELELMDLITISSPRPNQKITSPLEITGTARGQWFFEAQFSGKLLDDQGQELGTVILTADGEWMTEEFVPFSGLLEFTASPETSGTLILDKANASGLPEHDNSLVVPVSF